MATPSKQFTAVLFSPEPPAAVGRSFPPKKSLQNQVIDRYVILLKEEGYVAGYRQDTGVEVTALLPLARLWKYQQTAESTARILNGQVKRVVCSFNEQDGAFDPRIALMELEGM
jgi:hypothetical protein